MAASPYLSILGDSVYSCGNRIVCLTNLPKNTFIQDISSTSHGKSKSHGITEYYGYRTSHLCKQWYTQYCNSSASGGNQTGFHDLVPYNNPNLGFSLDYPANWEKEESLTFVSPQGGIGNRTPEVISVTTEALPTSNFSLDRYSDAAIGQVESFQDFKLLNSSSTMLAGLAAHMILYTFTDESQTPLQNLQVWAVKDGTAYVVTYGGTPEEFDSSLPAFQSIIDSFSLE